MRNVFLQNSCRTWGRETSYRSLFIFKKLFIRRKQVVSILSMFSFSYSVLIYFGRPLVGLTMKTRNKLNFDFLWKGLGLASPPYLAYDFPRKSFLMLCSINWPNFIVWLSLLLQILDIMYIVITGCQVCDVQNFGINNSFLFYQFFYITKMLAQNCKHLENEQNF